MNPGDTITLEGLRRMIREEIQHASSPVYRYDPPAQQVAAQANSAVERYWEYLSQMPTPPMTATGVQEAQRVYLSNYGINTTDWTFTTRIANIEPADPEWSNLI